jgi:hypothetical protein
MADKNQLKQWVLEALSELGGSGSVVDVCEVIWRRHEPHLRVTRDLFFTWQYDVRWAAQELRDAGELTSLAGNRRGPWQISP